MPEGGGACVPPTEWLLFLPCGGRGGGDDGLGRRAALSGRRRGFAFRATFSRGFIEQQIDDFRDTTADDQIDDPLRVFCDSALSHVFPYLYLINDCDFALSFKL